jgi:glycerol dehydrogenase
MARIIGSPLRYIQGNHEIDNLAKDIKDFGKSFFFLVDKAVWDRCIPSIQKSFKAEKITKVYFEKFGGECTMKECKRISALMKTKGCDAIVSVGGGKGCDTAKAVAFFNKSALIVFSTAASTDAPCSHSAIIYKENGEFDQYFYPTKSPDMVIVDNNIIAEAPVRLLVAGLGDALSTYFEARSAYASNRDVNE